MMDLYSSLSMAMQRRIDDAISYPTNCFFVEVTESDGQFVSVKLATSGENTYTECKKVPIVQSPYISPVVNPGDKGVMVNIHIDIGNLLEDKEIDGNIQGQDYCIFLPIITKKEFKSKTDTLTISSADLKSKIELTNEKLGYTLEKDLETIAKGKYDLTIDKAMTLTTKDAYKLEAKSFTVETKGTDPLVIKNSIGGFKEVMDQLFQCMDGLASGLTGPSSNPAAYQAVKAAAQQMISKIIG